MIMIESGKEALTPAGRTLKMPETLKAKRLSVSDGLARYWVTRSPYDSSTAIGYSSTPRWRLH